MAVVPWRRRHLAYVIAYQALEHFLRQPQDRTRWTGEDGIRADRQAKLPVAVLAKRKYLPRGRQN